MSDFRCGVGFDAHRFTRGRKLVLGGVEIVHTHGLAGHSDADVLIHAIIDALLGAAGLGDIGRHFPDTDEAYKNISSLILLETTRDKVMENGWEISFVDATIIAQRPKLSEHMESMRDIMAPALNLDNDRINLKATTTEGMGFAGREEGIAAVAVATLRK
jgi:2-C-methyl-D-erythritol 2,4-cyclodiphosphate synthase